ncbi:MAG TPA: FHA domain-containing protein [Phycisphaerae bacterium]|nr:FHA domain-containing protein [Phycisphaerae bacterium]
MLTKFSCSCGHQEAVAPDAVKRQLRCKACGALLSFSNGDPIHWLVVGGDNGSVTLAVPIPMEVPLKIGSANGSWIVLSKDIADDRQAELTYKKGGGLAVRHTARDKAKGTWVNQARILSGVLHDGDVLKIGPWAARLMAHPAVLALSRTVDRGVVVEEEFEEADEPTTAPVVYDDAAVADRPKLRTLRVTACIIVILFAGLYMARFLLWPGVSEDMPNQTTFYCPADGSAIRAGWNNGPPKCPQCGQLCLGPMRFTPETTKRTPPTTQPTSKASSAKAETNPPPKAGSGGKP